MAKWIEPTVSFFKTNLPRDARGGWNDHASTAYQIGCDALAALGHAKRERWGASPVTNPNTPDQLPLWHDIATSVIYLLKQKHGISFRLSDGSKTPKPVGAGMVLYIVKPAGSLSIPPANISAANGLGIAHIKEPFLPLLESLEIVKNGAWSAQSETVFWHSPPQEWKLEIESDVRFAESLERTVETCPEAIRALLDRGSMVDDQSLDESLDQLKKSMDAAKARTAEFKIPSEPELVERAKKSLLFRQSNNLDWIFFKCWRLDQTWLSVSDQKRAMHIFHDRLAISMRRAVVNALFPKSDLAESGL